MFTSLEALVAFMAQVLREVRHASRAPDCSYLSGARLE